MIANQSAFSLNHWSPFNKVTEVIDQTRRGWTSGGSLTLTQLKSDFDNSGGFIGRGFELPLLYRFRGRVN